VAEPRSGHDRATRRLWPALALPGTFWLVALFLVPFYAVMAVAFSGNINIFGEPIPAWNPLDWQFATFRQVISESVSGPYQAVWIRTATYTAWALLIAPFWISYMMRMLAWVNLLQDDGLVNDTLKTLGLGGVAVDWLDGRGFVVVLGLVYGYVPYMILPLFAGLDRLPAHALEAARDLGAGRLDTFRRVTLPLSLPAMAASVLLTCLPMLGDYFTVDLLSGSPRTAMVGNLINNSVLTPGQTGQAGAFVLLVLVVSLVPMLLYIRSVRSDGLAS